jgi:hypothetical protein
MKEKQLTAVEWLIEEMHKNIDWIPVPMQEQALEMEKGQMGYSEEEVRDAINLVKKYDEWSIEHGESFFAYIEDQIIKQLKEKQPNL